MIPALGLWLLALRSAAALDVPAGPAVSIDVDPCARLQSELFSQLAHSEFGEMLDRQEKTPFVTLVHVGCDDGGRIVLRVNDPITGKVSTRTLSSTELPDRTRERLVVLAVYELVTASWVEVEMYPNPAVPPASPAVPLRVREGAREVVREGMPARPPPRRWELGVGPFARVYPSGVLGTFGGAVAIDHLPLAWFGWRAELDLGAGLFRSRGEGTVGALDTSAAAFLQAHGAAARLRFHVALGLRGGVWRLRGDPGQATDFVGRDLTFGWFGPAAAAGLVLYPHARVGIRTTFEAGMLTRRTITRTESGDDVLRLQGAWLRPALMAEVRL